MKNDEVLKIALSSGAARVTRKYGDDVTTFTDSSLSEFVKRLIIASKQKDKEKCKSPSQSGPS